MSTTDLSAVLSSLHNARLTFQKLSDPISAHPAPGGGGDLTSHSDISDASSSPSSTFPATLDAELRHYKELFSQLRFSYLEQITKEKFLRDIAGDPPQLHESEENAALEEELKGAKAELKRCKTEVEDLLSELDAISSRLAPAHDQLRRDLSKAQSLPAETESARAKIEEHKRASHKRPEMNLPLSDTLEHIGAFESELKMLQTELESLQAILPRKERHLANLNKEILVHEANKEGLEKFASEAVRAREGARAAGKADRENAGQWYKSSYEVLSAMLQDETSR